MTLRTPSWRNIFFLVLSIGKIKVIECTPWLSSMTDRVTRAHVYFCINSAVGLSSIESRSKVTHF